MKKIILKSILALGVIAFAASMLAVSCGKTADPNNNNNNNANNSGDNNSGNNGGSGGNGDGSGGCTGICPTTNLVLAPASTMPSYVKISGNNATINAAGLAGVVTPHSDANADNRGFEDTIAAARKQLFVIEYPGATAVMFFVNRASVSTNNITMPATSTTGCSSSETGDEALATGGNANCRIYARGGDEIDFQSYLGAVFNNTDTANHARGSIRCNIGLSNYDAVSTSLLTITDTITFNQYSRIVCYIAVVNSAGTAAAAEIDDAWVTHAASTTEVELHAIGINVTGKTIPQFSSETGYNLARFITDHDNAAFKRLLQNNPWGELKFKVKIVTAANF